MMMFNEYYGPVPRSTLAVIRRYNVSPSDWDMMLDRWGFSWGDESLPFESIEDHIITHSTGGSYRWPMYG